MTQGPKVTVEGVTNPTVLSYMDSMNANDFDVLIDLFAPDGALQPPFQKPIAGKEAMMRFLQEDCQNLKLMPECGLEELTAEGYKQIKVTGKVQTPWFGAGVVIKIAWRFLLDREDRISLVTIEVLAPPQELLNLVR